MKRASFELGHTVIEVGSLTPTLRLGAGVQS